MIVQFEDGTHSSLYELLLDAYFKIAQDAPRLSMLEVAPLIRRPVEIEADAEYPELGIRSFGKGTFHKPAIRGDELNGKRIYRIEAGDLLFSNVFSWEGAVAVARPEDHGRYGSHRFITRLPKPGVATAQFLCFHYSTEKGLQQLRDASPGAAGRNRTLGLKTLDALTVPVPPYEKQLWFDEIQNRVNAVRQLQTEKAKLLEALLPSVLDRAFKGEL
jgi:type I restriction enzyme S subunit